MIDTYKKGIEGYAYGSQAHITIRQWIIFD